MISENTDIYTTVSCGVSSWAGVHWVAVVFQGMESTAKLPNPDRCKFPLDTVYTYETVKQ